VLHRCRIQPGADFRQHGFPQLPVVAMDADLDEFMGLEGLVDFRDHGFGKPGVADHHGGVQGMGTGLEGSALFGSELKHG
jgi:hypothetical protein